MLDNLPVDTLIRIYSYLNVYEIHRVCSTNHALFAMDNDKRIWMEALTLVSKATLDQLWYHWSLAKTFNTDLDAQQYKEICRQVHSIHDINQIRWIPLNYHQRCQHKGFDKMEAHTMSLLEGRYVAVVGGWSRAEGNRIYVLDGWTVPHHVITLETATVNNPRFRYGFGTVVYKNKLVVYGGCREGGYAYECNDLYVVDCTFHSEADAAHFAISDPAHKELFRKAPIGHFTTVTATYSDNLTRSLNTEQGIIPTKRAYHGSCIFSLEGRDHMLVWGGLHDNDLTGSLEYLDLDNMIWSNGISEGTEPCPRFGLTICPVTSAKQTETLASEDIAYQNVNKFIFTGGSNGTDLIRNGEELCDIHVLTLIQPTTNQPTAKFVWSTLKGGIDESLIPGRCHTAVTMGNKIIYFGGSANNSSDVFILDIPALEDLERLQEEGEHNNRQYLSSPEVVRSNRNSQSSSTSEATAAPKQIVPCNRCSATSVIIGRYMLMFGGWSNARRELGDLWALDLAPGLQACPRSSALQLEDANDLTRSVLTVEFDEDEYLEKAGRKRTRIDASIYESEEALNQILTIMMANGVDFFQAQNIFQGINSDGHEMEGHMPLDDDDEEDDSGLMEQDDNDDSSSQVEDDDSEDRFLDGDWEEEGPNDDEEEEEDEN